MIQIRQWWNKNTGLIEYDGVALQFSAGLCLLTGLSCS